MNEFDARCHHLQWHRRWTITDASLVDTTDLSWNLLPLLPPYLYAHLAMKPCIRSCEMHIAGKIRAQLCVTLTALGIRILHMFLWWNLIAKKRPSEWAPGNSRLIFKVLRCLDKDDLLLHRWCWRVQDAHCDGTRASAGRVIKAWLLPRIQSQMKKVHGLHRAGFWVLLDSEVKTCSFNGVWCKYEPVPVRCQAKKGIDEMSWDEVQVWSVDCGVWRVQCEVWGKCLHCTGVARRSCSWTATLQQLRTKHARTGLAGARRMQVP